MLLESACILPLNTLNPGGYNLIFSDMPLPFEIISAVGKANVELKRGWYAPSNLSKGGKKIFELKIGIHAPGMRIIAGRKGGKIGGKIVPKEQMFHINLEGTKAVAEAAVEAGIKRFIFT